MKHTTLALIALSLTAAVLRAADEDRRGRVFSTIRTCTALRGGDGYHALVLNLPPNKRAANLCFGGPKMDTLYVCAGDKVYRLTTQVKGVRSANAPQKPAAPRL